jgi:N-carbamoyl-L-amino-acid hydrolase
MGGNPDRIIEARRGSEEILAYMELHIEQGPLLFSRKIPIGVVKGIVGITRARIEVEGRSDHAGTTHMGIRKDALAAASETILALERICREREGVVGTVGKIDVAPNSLNVIPGTVILGADVRSLDQGLIEEVFFSLRREMEQIRERRGVKIRMEIEVVSKPVLFQKKVIERIRMACSRLHLPYLEMISGAGHDASHLAELTPTGMIFIPSKDGRSHCPEEWSEFEEICLGTEVLADAIKDLDKEGTN